MPKKLTAIAITALKPHAERYEISDSGSALRLLILPSGRKSFILRYRRADGRSAKLTLGQFDPSAEPRDEPILGAPMTLGQARQLVAEMLRHKARGVDPGELRAKAGAAQSETVGAVAEAYAEHLRQNNRRGRETAKIVLAITKPWALKPLSSIAASDCLDVVERCRKHGFPDHGTRYPGPSDSRARLAHTTLSGLFSWALKQRRVERSPMAGLGRPKAPAARERVLDDSEIRIFWKAAEALSPWHCACLRLLLLTGARLKEIARLRFDEIRDGAIELAPARTKNKRTHTIPLSPLAREILDGSPAIEGSRFVFSRGRASIGGWSRVKAELDMAMRAACWNGLPWRIHDLRRTCATGLARLGVPIHVTEKILNHASGTITGIAAVYNRHSYANECREALELWAIEVAKMTGENVVRLPLAKAT
jgi:integrase